MSVYLHHVEAIICNQFFLLLLFIIYLICQKRQGDTKRQSLYEGVSLEDTKPKTEGTNTEKTQLQKKTRKDTYTYKLITTKQIIHSLAKLR